MRCRSSRSQLFFKIGILKNFAIVTGKHLCWSHFLIKVTPAQVFSYEYCENFKRSFFSRTPLVAVSGDVSETLKPDGQILSMKINCLNPSSVNGTILNLDKRKEKNELNRPIIIDEIMICFWQRSLQIHKLRHLPKVSFFGTQYVKFVWKRRINRIFH